jgi:hypothetical protein
VFTVGRQQRHPNHNTTTYHVYWRTTTTINPIIIRPHCMFTDRRQQRQPSYYDCVYCCCRPSVNMICGRIMIGLSMLSSVSIHTMWSYYTINTIIIRPHIVFTDRRQQRQPNDNTTTNCVYWRTTTTINPIIIRPHFMSYNVVVLWLGLLLLSSVSKHNMWSYYDWVVVVVVCQ